MLIMLYFDYWRVASYIQYLHSIYYRQKDALLIFTMDDAAGISCHWLIKSR